MGSILYAKKVKIHVKYDSYHNFNRLRLVSVKVFESDLSAWLHVHDFVKIVIEYGFNSG